MILQILVNSILSAMLLALIAIGFNMIFNVSKIFHLAHGAFYTSAVYLFYGLRSIIGKHLSLVPTILVSIVTSLLGIGLLILLVEYFIYRPLIKSKSNPVISLISSLCVYLVMINILILIFGNDSITLNPSYAIIIDNKFFRMTTADMVVFVFGTIVIASVLLFTRTNLYNQIKAISDSTLIAKKFGINEQRIRIIVFLVGTILVGIAGILKANQTAFEPNLGLTAILTASAAVIVGGVNSLTGTLIACFVIALLENFSVAIIPAIWKDSLTYFLLIMVLVFYRKGLISIKQRIETR